jgi:hypothetical protein
MGDPAEGAVMSERCANEGLLAFECDAGERFGELAPTLFAGFFEVLIFFKVLHNTFFVALLFEATECFFKRLIAFYADFRHG